MRFKNYIDENVNENFIIDTIKKIGNKPSKAVLKLFQDSFKKFIKMIKGEKYSDVMPQILIAINKGLGTKFKNIKDLERMVKTKPKISESEEMVNEDWKHFWKAISSSAFPTLSFYPGLTVWLEIDKIIRSVPGVEANFKIIAAYSVLWLLLISGKFIKDFKKWKKEKPEEYYSERPHLKEVPASVGQRHGF